MATATAVTQGLVADTGLLFGVLLLAAIVGGYAVRALHIPRVVGYLLAGAAVRSALHWSLDVDPGSDMPPRLSAAERPLTAIRDLALGLILFSIGGVFETGHLRSVGRRIWRIALCEAGLTFTLVCGGTIAALTIVAGPGSLSTNICFALLLGCASIATAPAATLFVLREYDAKGPVTDAILSTTGVNNVLCIVAFHACFLVLASWGLLGDVSQASTHVGIGLAVTVGGSAAIGLALGVAMSLIHARLQLAETILIFVALMIVLGAGEHWLLHRYGLSYNALLASLCLGAVFANVAINPDKLDDAVRTLGGPVLVGLFVLAGYRLHLADIPALGLIGGAYVVLRATGKIAGGWMGLKWSGMIREAPPQFGAALLCQAAVVIGLAGFVETHWKDDWAAGTFAVTIYGSVVLFELAGPVLTKWVAVRAGEVKAVTLLRRTGATESGGASMLRLTWDGLRRMFGLTPAPGASGAELCVRHVMRSNVKCLHADDMLDEVLHFVERSRYNHFPVTNDDGDLVGVIHFADIREMLYDPLMRDLVTAVDLASPNPRRVPVDMPLTEALTIFREADVGSIPVVDRADSRRVVGIVEQRDLLRALHRPNGASG